MSLDMQAITRNELWRQGYRHAPAVLGVLLTAALAWQAAALTWKAVELLSTEPSLPPPAQINDPGSRRVETVSIESITNAHLFGQADAQPVEIAAAAADAPETRLNLKLRGILAADEPEYSRAIITSGNQDKVYAVGDTVATGTTVEGVLADRVLLRRSGRLETLRLPREIASTGGGVEYQEPVASEEVRDVSDIRAEVAADPKRLSDLIRYSPVLENGAIRGYRIYPGRDRARFAELGLQAGDIVTAVNGMSLSDPRQATEMMNSLTDASDITLTVERNGSPMTITLAASQ